MAASLPSTQSSSGTHHANLEIISNSDEAPAPSGCWAAFTRVICCCFPRTQVYHANQQTAQRCSQFLIKNFGELVAKTAQLITHINLDSKEPGALLSQDESIALTERAAFIHSHLNELKKMIQHVRYYNDALQPLNQLEDADELVASSAKPIESVEPEFHAGQVDVIKRNGLIEKFNEQKIVIGLQEAPFQIPLSPEQIGEIVNRVKQQIAVLQSAGINSGFIRRIVNQETSRLGAEIIPPPFLAQISKAEILEGLQKVKGLDQLSPEGCEALLQFLPSTSDVDKKDDDSSSSVD